MPPLPDNIGAHEERSVTLATYRRPAVDLWIADLAANDDRPLTEPYLTDAESIPVLRGMHEAEPRLRRGASKLSIGWAALVCLSALALAGTVIMIGAGLLAGLAALSSVGAGR